MIRTTLTAAAVLLAATPAISQSFYPTLYGARFCELRRLGISQDEAVTAAMREAFSRYRTTSYVTLQGKQVSLDVLDAARYVTTHCPELVK